ncbi:MAG: methyltransferase domain-containing protein [Dehalococcoidia bacterium]|nr:methyltransferase domain-containing protein [Dehalococcoidia bacterium]
MNENLHQLLRCPACRAGLATPGGQLTCLNESCKCTYPVIDGIPVLINESSSIFSINDFLGRKPTFFRPRHRLLKFAIKLLPDIDKNFKAAKNLNYFARLLPKESERPVVVIIGASHAGRGTEALLSNPGINCIESDVSFGPRTTLICDAHRLPFENNSIDGVIIQAVLEHVLDPYQCVREIHRVLKPQGLVYAESAFIQQVHGQRYDFTRFTHLGHRRLFRQFEEISSGAVGGTGMALAWAYRYFLLSLVKSHTARLLVGAFARLTAFWLKYLDYLLIDRPASLDAASAFYFLGRKDDRILEDRDLIRLYRGAA